MRWGCAATRAAHEMRGVVFIVARRPPIILIAYCQLVMKRTIESDLLGMRDHPTLSIKVSFTCLDEARMRTTMGLEI